MGQTGWSPHQKTLYIATRVSKFRLLHSAICQWKKCVKSYWTKSGLYKDLYRWCLPWETWTSWCRPLNEGQWNTHSQSMYIKGKLGVPLTLGFLGIITQKYPLYRTYIGISHKGTLVGVHPTIPWPTEEIRARLRSWSSPRQAAEG